LQNPTTITEESTSPQTMLASTGFRHNHRPTITSDKL